MTTSDAPRDLGAYLFTIALIADTHLNESEHGSASPFECNRVANARTRWVVSRLNQLGPELTIHLGDLVHPVPELPTYEQAARNFHELTRGLRSPLRLVPGNHDVGDKPVAWAPAATVTEAYLALWRRHFGEHFYAFDFRGLHFVVIDAQIINSGLPAEAEQRRWLERDLAANAGRRTFLCLHYPPYVCEPDESESYDNLAEPGRSWLLGLVETYRPEAMFCGHVHNFWYNRHGETDCYILPSTAFVRHDYSELYRVAPPAADERGRNDLPKLGFFAVRIYERGHVCHVIRTYGATLEPGEEPAPAAERVAPRHARENFRAPLGVVLRQPWAETVEIAATGAVDEFERKKIRNDYPLLALWEMGIRKLRLPLQDLSDPGIRNRLRVLRHSGHEFTAYSFDVPQGRARDVLIEHHDLLTALEVVAPWPDVAPTLDAIGELKGKAPLTVYLSRLRRETDAHWEARRYHHFIDHGFVASERGAIEGLLGAGARGVVDGFTYRILRQVSPWSEIAAIAEIAAASNIRAAVVVRMNSWNPAEPFEDDSANANRVAEALAAAVAHGTQGIDVFLDSFADVDRGYFPRTGLVDRRWNPRLAAHVIRNLYAALNETPAPLAPAGSDEIPNGKIFALRRPTELLALVAPERTLRLDQVRAAAPAATRSGTAKVVDLATGSVSRRRWERRGEGLAIDGGVACAVPTLICFANPRSPGPDSGT
jgi:predicted phosphodiesterase